MRRLLLITMLLLTGCRHAPDHVLPAAAMGAGPRDVVLTAPAATSGTSERSAYAAVAAALAKAGYRQRSDAPAQVEIGMAERPPRVMLDGEPRVRPHLLPSLCRRKTYTLSIAIVDRSTGTVRVRGSASASRCGKADEALLARLAQLAVLRL